MAMFMRNDPSVRASHTGDEASFAFSTVRQRWPKIVNSAIEEIDSVLSLEDELAQVDFEAGEHIRSQLHGLQSDMMSNAELRSIPDDGGPDVKAYNDELETLSSPEWHSVPWLYSECYMYRLIHTFFSTSTPFWKSFDVFASVKELSLVGSEKGTLELVKRFEDVLKVLEQKNGMDEESQKTLFEEVVQISLWGNATDLSLLTTLTLEDLNSRQGKEARERAKANVLVDDTAEAWSMLSGLKSSGTVHIVLDNAGFELLTDLVLAGYLLESGHAKHIVLHGKRLPWFVSDVQAHDFEYLLDSFVKGSPFTDITSDDKASLHRVGSHWTDLVRSKKLEFRAHPFWTTAHSFGRLPDVEPELFAELTTADLVVFKGDLNYRKLVYDCYWPKDTPFSRAIGQLGKKHGGNAVRVFALRTCKADVCVGLKPGQEDSLPKGWTRTGQYGVVHYFDGKL